jgi:GDP-4-dehydro-6-deoxy-D-mannose reductase
MKAFVTGLTGFVGPYLARMLVGKGVEVAGLGLHNHNGSHAQNLPHGVSVINADIRDYTRLRQILKDLHPDQVYHLAAISNASVSLKDPRNTYDVNVGGTLNLFESLRELEIKPRIVLVSTALVYRSMETQEGLDENSAVRLLTPYAASKFMCEALAAQCVEAYGFQAMTVRPFNHVGPGQPIGFVCSDFARQIAAIKLGKADPVLRVGNLDAVRDFTDVRDTVNAYWSVATMGIPGKIYNVGSQHPISIKEIVSMLCDVAGVQVQIKVDPEKFRPIETLRLFGDATKIRALGWNPQIEFRRTLKDIFDWWLAKLGNGHS